MRVRIALVVICAGPGGIEFGIERSVDRMRFAGMPFAPAGRVDLVAHLEY